jgi:pimeloyl-ACP methyl ester carboxylesterase
VQLHYDRLGQGPHILLAFHGIGQTGHECYQPFVELLGDHYTIYAFDLFHHGKSMGVSGNDSFNSQDVVGKDLWRTMLLNFLNQEKITQFDVAGFSMGGRFALATAEATPEYINNIFLMAPDGVVEHPLYHLATRFPPARWIYHQITRYPAPLFTVAHLAQKTGLLPKNMLRFIRHILATPQSRRVIYRSWVSFRTLEFSIPKLYKALLANQINTWLFVGKYDPLLPPEKVNILSERLPADHYIILETGHTRLVEKTVTYLKKYLK